MLYLKPDQAGSNSPVCIGLVYFQSLLGLRVLLVFYMSYELDVNAGK